MKKINLFILLLTIIINPIYSGDEVNNGGGLAEKNIMLAYLNLDKYIRACLNSDLCGINNSETVILKNILQSLPQEYQNKKQIVFMSESENPGTFIINGQVKLAKTGNLVGSPIYVNQDLLYSKDSLGIYIPMDLTQAISFLIHEMGHHHNELDHQALDLLGNKVSLLTNIHQISSSMNPYKEDLKIIVFNENKFNSHPQILLYIGPDIIDISKDFYESFKCKEGRRPLTSIFYNFYWKDLILDTFTGEFTIRGNLYMDCQDKVDIVEESKKRRADIKFKTIKVYTDDNYKKYYWKYLEKTVSVKEFVNWF